MNEIKFEGGTNLAMKIPENQYDATLHFYADILLLEVEEINITHPTILKSARVKFGANSLWLDCVKDIACSTIWLELTTTQLENALNYLKTNGTETCDEIEEIPPNMHLIKDPTGNILLLREHTSSDDF